MGGGFLALLNTANETASPDVNRSASGEEDMRAAAAAGWGCCSGCSGSSFCSPVSGTCYAWKNKDYYHDCSTPSRSCCSGCPGSAFAHQSVGLVTHGRTRPTTKHA